MEKYFSNIGLMTWDPNPSISNRTDNCRYISFGNYDSTDFGLIMIDSSALSSITPKRETKSIPFNNGSIDVSQRKSHPDSFYGDLFFNSRNIAYKFNMFIPKIYPGEIGDGNIETNQRVFDAIDAVKYWVHLEEDGPSRDYPSGTILFDSAFSALPIGGLRYENATCSDIRFDKIKETPELWVIQVDMVFDADPLLDSIALQNLVTMYPDDLIFTPPSNLRSIEFNWRNSKDLGMTMVNATPSSQVSKRKEDVTSYTKDGYINKTTPFGFAYRNDREIEYVFEIIFNKGFRNVNEMNGWIQVKCEEIYSWLYKNEYVQEGHYLSVDMPGGLDVVMYGTSDLYDDLYSHRENKYSFARCSDVSFAKRVSINAWVLEVNVKFTTYPILGGDVHTYK